MNKISKKEAATRINEIELKAIAALTEAATLRRELRLQKYSFKGIAPSEFEFALSEKICAIFRTGPREFWENLKSRKREYMFPRSMFALYLRDECEYKLKQIGNVLRKDHSTMVHAIEVAEDLLITDKYVRDEYLNLKQKIHEARNYA